MLRSMFSAVSGLRSHQTMMDVTGNNVANVNTSGFKSSRTTFQESLNQAVRGGNGGVANQQGGVNPMQLGLGSQVGATDMVFTQGASQATGRATDVAIQGEGFFVVNAGDERFFTRGGAFSLDDGGQLVTAGGELVQGWAPGAARDEGTLGAIAIGPGLTDIAIGQNGMVSARDAAGDIVDVAQLALARFPNAGGLDNAGNGLFQPGGNAGATIFEAAGENGLGTLQSGTLEMSNVDLAQEFTNLILSQRGFQANARTITTSDELLQELVNLKR